MPSFDERKDMSKDAILEMERTTMSTAEGLQLFNINKRFISDWSSLVNKITSGRVRDRSINALSNVFLTIEMGQCFGLLGHNGAGKTTLINILCGVYTPSTGSCFLLGNSLTSATGIDRIQKLIGLCPQHDVLFPDLTALEHLELFADIKGIPVKERRSTINQRLKEVELYDVRKKKATAFSGGMRRRLSLAIACIGNPKVLILDEPTTGLDPINKRKVWDLINKMKRERIIILATHSMSEVEYLSDRIGIMTGGRINCLGSAKSLKTRYGDGHNISITTHSVDAANKIDELMVSYDMSILSRNGTMLKFKVNSERRLGDFMGDVEEGNISGIKNWSLMNSSLEDVFIKISKNPFLEENDLNEISIEDSIRLIKGELKDLKSDIAKLNQGSVEMQESKESHLDHFDSFAKDIEHHNDNDELRQLIIRQSEKIKDLEDKINALNFQHPQ
ncbi:ABC transporter A family protein [Acrasis kona]|uniref:ABC transporter A family protein n=1 Tax=Acrasis kona TaxID=1008807 RepID=A0AAW2ZNS5_9EUKA